MDLFVGNKVLLEGVCVSLHLGSILFGSRG